MARACAAPASTLKATRSCQCAPRARTPRRRSRSRTQTSRRSRSRRRPLRHRRRTDLMRCRLMSPQRTPACRRCSSTRRRRPARLPPWSRRWDTLSRARRRLGTLSRRTPGNSRTCPTGRLRHSPHPCQTGSARWCKARVRITCRLELLDRVRRSEGYVGGGLRDLARRAGLHN